MIKTRRGTKDADMQSNIWTDSQSLESTVRNRCSGKHINRTHTTKMYRVQVLSCRSNHEKLPRHGGIQLTTVTICKHLVQFLARIYSNFTDFVDASNERWRI